MNYNDYYKKAEQIDEDFVDLKKITGDRVLIKFALKKSEALGPLAKTRYTASKEEAMNPDYIMKRARAFSKIPDLKWEPGVDELIRGGNVNIKDDAVEIEIDEQSREVKLL